MAKDFLKYMLDLVSGKKSKLNESLDFCAYVIKECVKRNYFIDFSKIQCIMYCVYGANLAVFDKKICKETPVTFSTGPVFDRILKYNYYGHCELIDELLQRKENFKTRFSDEQRVLTEYIINYFGQKRSQECLAWLTKENTPWHITFNQSLEVILKIDDKLTKNFFEKIIVSKELAQGTKS